MKFGKKQQKIRGTRALIVDQLFHRTHLAPSCTSSINLREKKIGIVTRVTLKQASYGGHSERVSNLANKNLPKVEKIALGLLEIPVHFIFFFIILIVSSRRSTFSAAAVEGLLKTVVIMKSDFFSSSGYTQLTPIRLLQLLSYLGMCGPQQE